MAELPPGTMVVYAWLMYVSLLGCVLAGFALGWLAYRYIQEDNCPWCGLPRDH
jgi:hypothetical protein